MGGQLAPLSNNFFFFSFLLQVSRILYSFSTAFRRSSRPADVRDSPASSPPDSDLYTFTVSLEIKEDDGKGNYKYSCTFSLIPDYFIQFIQFYLLSPIKRALEV